MHHRGLSFVLAAATALVLALSAGSGTSAAAPWNIDRGLLPDAQEAHLRERFKSVDTPAELENLLHEIDRRFPASKLEARIEAFAYQIRGIL